MVISLCPFYRTLRDIRPQKNDYCLQRAFSTRTSLTPPRTRSSGYISKPHRILPAPQRNYTGGITLVSQPAKALGDSPNPKAAFSIVVPFSFLRRINLGWMFSIPFPPCCLLVWHHCWVVPNSSRMSSIGLKDCFPLWIQQSATWKVRTSDWKSGVFFFTIWSIMLKRKEYQSCCFSEDAQRRIMNLVVR